MYKVVAYPMGCLHFYATCRDCSWTFEDYLKPQEGYKEIRKHVSNSGHTVHLERGVMTDYSPEEGNPTPNVADGFPPNHRDEPFCECSVCMGFTSRAPRRS